MRFAAIADVHGNYLALEAVVADIRAQRLRFAPSRAPDAENKTAGYSPAASRKYRSRPITPRQ